LILKDKILFETLEKIKMSVIEIDKSPSSEQKNDKKLVTKLVGNRGTQTPDREFPSQGQLSYDNYLESISCIDGDYQINFKFKNVGISKYPSFSSLNEVRLTPSGR
jgi:hypothetical protein